MLPPDATLDVVTETVSPLDEIVPAAVNVLAPLGVVPELAI